MPNAADYQLHALLGVSGATVIFILTGAVLLGGFTAKYVHLFERYRGLTSEFRQIPGIHPRKESLLQQIGNYRRRIHFLNIASICMGVAVLVFLLTVVVASLSVIYPALPYLRFLGTLGVLLGLFLSGAAIILDVAEVVVGRRVIEGEVADIPNVPDDGGFSRDNHEQSASALKTSPTQRS
jgi:hypothetical protein